MSVRPKGLTYPCYLMYCDSKGEWRWVFYAGNGEEIAVSSEGYIRRSDCARGVEIMRASAPAPVVDRGFHELVNALTRRPRSIFPGVNVENAIAEGMRTQRSAFRRSLADVYGPKK